MHWTNIGLILVAGLDIIMALLIWLRNVRNKINILFASAFFCFGVWTFFVFLSHGLSVQDNLNLFFRFKKFIGMYIVYFLYVFTIFFPFQNKKIKFFDYSIIIIYPIFSFLIFLPDDQLIGYAKFEKGGNIFLVNKYFWFIYSLFFSYLLIGSFCKLLKKYISNSGFTRIQTGYVISAVALAGGGGIIFNIILPFSDNFRNEWVGALLTFPVFFIISHFLFFKKQ